jgi:DNA-directed RNA polymerase subunit E'/Rpb7
LRFPHPNPQSLLLLVSVISPSSLYSDTTEKTWVWRTEESEVWFDIGTVVNLRVEAEKWVDQAPKAPSKNNSAAAVAGVDAAQERAMPYSIEVSTICLFCQPLGEDASGVGDALRFLVKASMAEAGLGGVEWW